MPRPKIISASRRTDIPAYYSEWFFARLRAGFCAVPNPINPKQVSRVSLRPEEVLAILFWTRNPRPMLHRLGELDQLGYRYYFHFTLMNNPKVIDPGGPGLSASLKTFRALADRVGKERVIWRYDPLVFTGVTDADFHLNTFAGIAGALEGATSHCMVSIMDSYRKTRARLRELSTIEGMALQEYLPAVHEPLLQKMCEIAGEKGMVMTTCAETIELSHLGIHSGKCVDDQLIKGLWGVECRGRKDSSQRPACRCVESRDIGVYNTCLTGCLYCYATVNFGKAMKNYREHDVSGPCLLSTIH
ncbi:MAG: DUF1848 domain-containing protein [Gammaproteobacteria bacterium]|nr:DUF1848 domain-containing protein [Gammaproteobacteria bacterium]